MIIYRYLNVFYKINGSDEKEAKKLKNSNSFELEREEVTSEISHYLKNEKGIDIPNKYNLRLRLDCKKKDCVLDCDLLNEFGGKIEDKLKNRKFKKTEFHHTVKLEKAGELIYLFKINELELKFKIKLRKKTSVRGNAFLILK